MDRKDLDKILKDGGKMTMNEKKSSDLINIINSDIFEYDRKECIKNLCGIWKSIQYYEKKYPDSNYVQYIKELILEKAKESLSSEIYDKIYE